MAPDVVVHRQELLHTCMKNLLAANPHAPTLTPLLAFLNPAHVTCPLEQDTVTCSAAQEATPSTDSTPSAGPPSSRGVPLVGLQGWHGSRIRLLTDLPVRLTDREVLQRQQGCCAGCHGRLALPYLVSGWLGRLHRQVIRCCMCQLPQAVCAVCFIFLMLCSVVACYLGSGHSQVHACMQPTFPKLLIAFCCRVTWQT